MFRLNSNNSPTKLRVLHKSANFLVVNKHPDLVFNTNPPDDRWDITELTTSPHTQTTRLSLYEQIAFKYPELIQPKLVHGFYVAHRLDYSTVTLINVFDCWSSFEPVNDSPELSWFLSPREPLQKSRSNLRWDRIQFLCVDLSLLSPLRGDKPPSSTSPWCGATSSRSRSMWGSTSAKTLGPSGRTSGWWRGPTLTVSSPGRPGRRWRCWREVCIGVGQPPSSSSPPWLGGDTRWHSVLSAQCDVSC